MPESTREFIPTRRSLLSRLKRWDDQESWQDFFNTYWKLIYGVATRAGLSDSEAQDVVQDTMVAVARQMPNFKYDPALGSFKSWLFLITRRRITDHLRKEYRRVKGDEPTPGDTRRTAAPGTHSRSQRRGPGRDLGRGVEALAFRLGLTARETPGRAAALSDIRLLRAQGVAGQGRSPGLSRQLRPGLCHQEPPVGAHREGDPEAGNQPAALRPESAPGFPP